MKKWSLSNTLNPYYDSEIFGNLSTSHSSDTVPGSNWNEIKNNEKKMNDIANVTNLKGIFGIPYQFLDTVDYRCNGSTIGRKYTEKILSRSPLLFLTPCTQKFLEGFKAEDQATILAQLTSSGHVAVGDVSKTGKYYTTEFAFDEYYRTVNKMCSELSYFLGISDVEVPNLGKLGNVNWANSLNSTFKKFFASKSSVVFYMDGSSIATVSDSFSNSSTESALANTINQYGDMSRELQFLLGPESALAELMNKRDDITANIQEGLGDIISGLTGEMLADLASTGINTILSGGKIIFPKIWGDSQYNRSYSFEIKLRSPDHDKISIFLNVLVPFVHLLGMTLPRSVDSNNPNAFQSPLLVKAFCKGMFNIDMGLITDLSVSRGAECQWNDDGLPTQIDISISIEDLYQSLMLTRVDGSGTIIGNMINNNLDLVTNTAMVDFLANMAGLNVADVEVGRRVYLYYAVSKSDVARLPSTIYTIADNMYQNFIHRITRNFV